MKKELKFGTMVVYSGTVESILRHRCGTLRNKFNFEPRVYEKEKQEAAMFEKLKPASTQHRCTKNGQKRFISYLNSRDKM